MKKYLLFISLAFLFSSCNFWCKLWGDVNLGDNFSLMLGDNHEDRLLIYCSGRSGGCCHAGTPVIPSRNDMNTKYVDDAVNNDKWIIVRAINFDNTKSYFIIDKEFSISDKESEDSIIQAHVIGPMNPNDYSHKVDSLKIGLEFHDYVAF